MPHRQKQHLGRSTEDDRSLEGRDTRASDDELNVEGVQGAQGGRVDEEATDDLPPRDSGLRET